MLKALPRTAASAKIIGDQCSVNDPNAHVRLQALVAFQEISNKPSGLPAMSTAFANTDTYSTNAVQDAGITTAATAGCTIALDAVGTDPDDGTAVGQRVPQPRSDLRLETTRDGFRLLPHGQLPDGEIRVADARGRVVFESSYSARNLQWSRPTASGLKSQVYVYSFKGKDGSFMQGRFFLSGQM